MNPSLPPNSTSLVGAVAQVAADIEALPAVTTATVDELDNLLSDVEIALVIAGQAQDFFDAQMGVVGASAKFAGGTDPDVMVANVNDLLQCAKGLNYAIGVKNSLARLAKNIQSIQD